MKELNVELQGTHQFARDMRTNVKAFESRLALFSGQMWKKSFTHFPAPSELKEAGAGVKPSGQRLRAAHGDVCRVVRLDLRA